MIQKKLSCSRFGRKRAFTLIELIVALAIGSLILALIYNFLSTSLNLSTGTMTKLNRLDDTEYALSYIRDEVNSCRYFIDSGNRLTLYTYDTNQSPHHLYSQYYLEDNKLYRGAIHFDRELDGASVNKITRGKNLILEDVDDFSYRIEGDLLVIDLGIDGKTYLLNHFLRGQMK